LALSFFTCQASWQGSKVGGVHALACKLALRPDKPAGGVTTPAKLNGYRKRKVSQDSLLPQNSVGFVTSGTILKQVGHDIRERLAVNDFADLGRDSIEGLVGGVKFTAHRRDVHLGEAIFERG